MKPLVLAAAFAIAALCHLPLIPSASGQNLAEFTTLHNFGGYENLDGAEPRAGLVLGSDGILFGTTYYGSAGDTQTIDKGTVFAINSGGDYAVLRSFDNLDGGGYACSAGLVEGSDGVFYGTTSLGGYQPGGDAGQGTVFSVTREGVLTVLHQFDQANEGEGSIPEAGLVEGEDGRFYGTTFSGGTSNEGTVFAISSAGDFTTLHSFSSADGEGVNPVADLLPGSDGRFYGTTLNGGPENRGTVFVIDADGTFTNLYSFAEATGDGAGPQAGLIEGSDGRFYGTTQYGGVEGSGTVYSITSDGEYATVYSFLAGGENASQPYGKLVQAGDGRFYGTTYSGGQYGYGGAVFSVTSEGVFNVTHSFNPDDGDGAYPVAGLVDGGDGYLYGTTSGTGGSHGTVFKIGLDPTPLPSAGPVVRLRALVPEVAVDSGQAGKYLLVLDRPAETDLRIAYTVGGSARNGVDYVTLRGTALVKAGTTRRVIQIVPEGDLGGASMRIVRLTLAPGDGYEVGTARSIKVTILAAE